MVPDKSQANDQSMEELLEAFKNAPDRKRRGLVQLLEQRSSELAQLESQVMSSFDKNGDNWAAGFILQLLNIKHKEFLYNEFLCEKDTGWFNAPSDRGIDYGPLQESLLEQRFEDADRFTSSKLRELAGEGAVTRGYVYFSEVGSIPGIDLLTIDRLWVAYSKGRFGFSVQARLLNSLGGRYEKLWPRIGWKKDGVWTRYPGSFTWDLEAPEGHMPLINQLRGIRLMDAILNHPALLKRR